MDNFSLGVFSIIGVVVFVVLYVFFRLLRKGGAWMTNEEAPKEKFIPFLVLLAVIGFIAGSLIQNLYDDYEPCMQQGLSFFECTFR